MQKYNVLQALYLSFYSKDFYRDVHDHWGGKVFLYLLMLIALSWIALVIQLQIALNLAYSKNSDKIVSQIPVMTIKNGVMTTPENRPYFIHDLANKEIIAVIDTSGKYTSLEQAKAGILVTGSEILTQPKPNETRVNRIPTNLNMVLDPKVINGYIQKYLHFAWILLFVVFALFAYFYRIIESLIYAIIGKIYSAITGAGLLYDEILLITMMALTPPIILATVLDFFSIYFPYQALLYFVLAMFYLFYGITANKKPKI